MYRPACRIIQIGGRSMVSPRIARSMSGASVVDCVVDARDVITLRVLSDVIEDLERRGDGRTRRAVMRDG